MDTKIKEKIEEMITKAIKEHCQECTNWRTCNCEGLLEAIKIRNEYQEKLEKANS